MPQSKVQTLPTNLKDERAIRVVFNSIVVELARLEQLLLAAEERIALLEAK